MSTTDRSRIDDDDVLVDVDDDSSPQLPCTRAARHARGLPQPLLAQKKTWCPKRVAGNKGLRWGIHQVLVDVLLLVDVDDDGNSSPR